MNEELHKWKSTEYIAQYIEQVRLDLLEDNQASLVALSISLDRNYGFILKTKEQLNRDDHETLITYIVEQLKSYDYRVNREGAGEIMLQASVKARVHGKQLFGTTKVIDKGFEIRVLVTPYIDRFYEKASLRKELIELLFG